MGTLPMVAVLGDDRRYSVDSTIRASENFSCKVSLARLLIRLEYRPTSRVHDAWARCPCHV